MCDDMLQRKRKVLTMLDLTFNTSRMYARDGQVIRATYDPATLELRFDDFSRMISGVFRDVSTSPDQLARWERFPEIFARAVMHRYDAGGYDWAPSRMAVDFEPRVFRL